MDLCSLDLENILRTHLALLFSLLLSVPAVAGPISISFTCEQHIPFVQVQSSDNNQPPLYFILDTGSSPTIVNWISVGSLNMGFRKIYQPGKDFATARTCGIGDSPAGYIYGLRAKCGGIPLRPTALRTDISNISLSFGHRVDGLLGTDFLKDQILTMNFESHSLQFEQAPRATNIFARIFGAISLEKHEALFVKIATPSSKRPLVFLVDTGSSHCIIDSGVAKRLNLSRGAQCIVNVVGGQQIANIANNFSGTLDGYSLPSQVTMFDLSNVSWSLSHHIDGILGMDFMENFTVKINFHTGQMQLLPNQEAFFPARKMRNLNEAKIFLTYHDRVSFP